MPKCYFQAFMNKPCRFISVTATAFVRNNLVRIAYRKAWVQVWNLGFNFYVVGISIHIDSALGTQKDNVFSNHVYDVICKLPILPSIIYMYFEVQHSVNSLILGHIG